MEIFDLNVQTYILNLKICESNGFTVIKTKFYNNKNNNFKIYKK